MNQIPWRCSKKPLGFSLGGQQCDKSVNVNQGVSVKEKALVTDLIHEKTLKNKYSLQIQYIRGAHRAKTGNNLKASGLSQMQSAQYLREKMFGA